MRKKRTLVLVIVGLLATASAALAAWIVFSGGSGTTGTAFGAPSQTQDAVTFATPTLGTAAGTDFAAACTDSLPYHLDCTNDPVHLTPSGSFDLLFLIKDNAAVDEGFTVDPTKLQLSDSQGGTCLSHVTVNNGAFATPQPNNTITTGGSGWIASASKPGYSIGYYVNALSVDATVPASCANATVSITIPEAAVATTP